MAKGPSKQTRKKRKKMRAEFQLAGPRLREPSGRVKSVPLTAAARKVDPTREQEMRLAMLKGGYGSPDDPLAVARVNGVLTELQCEALHRYRNICQAYQMATGAPRAAPDVLATFFPHARGEMTDDEALRYIQDAYRAADDALRACWKAEHSRLQMVVAEWGRTFTDRTCEILEYPAKLLAHHFWPERAAEAKVSRAA